MQMSPALVEHIKAILIAGAAVFSAIEGLKNLPWWKDWFKAHGNVAVIINAGLTLCASLGICLSGTLDSGFFICTATAVGVFLTAAGIHSVKTALAVPPEAGPK